MRLALAALCFCLATAAQAFTIPKAQDAVLAVSAAARDTMLPFTLTCTTKGDKPCENPRAALTYFASATRSFSGPCRSLREDCVMVGNANWAMEISIGTDGHPRDVVLRYVEMPVP